MSELRSAFEKIIQKANEHRTLYIRSEQAVRDQLISPILKILGWDTTDPNFVHANVTNDDGKIPDYNLLKNKKNVLILEAKKLSSNLDDAKVIKQLANYCYPAGIEFGILTDGIVWQLFNTFERNPTNRIVWTVDISQCEDKELAKLEMLSYDRIENLEEELNHLNTLNDYFTSIFQTKESFLNWCESSLSEKFIKDNKQYKFKEDNIKKYVFERITLLFEELSVPEIPAPTTIPILSDSVDVSTRKYRNYELNSSFDLTFTRVIEGHIENDFAKNWSGLLHIMLKQLILSGKPIGEISNLSVLNIEQGNLSSNGFSLIENTNYSVQGVDATKAARAIIILAKKYGKKLEIEFQWKDKEKAAFPNEYGKIIMG